MNQHRPDNLTAILDEDNSPESLTMYFAIRIIDMLIYISGTLATIGVMYGGARYMFSFGGDTAKEEAKKTLIWSL